MPSRLVDGLRKRYAGIEGNPETATSGEHSATSGPDPENAVGSPVYPAWEAHDPNEPGVEGQFTSTRQIPYRGAEPHGVPFTPQTHPDPVLTETPNIAGQVPIHTPEPAGLPDMEPVPVRIVENLPDLTVRKRFITNTMTLPGTSINPTPTPIRIAGYRPNRTKLKVWTRQIPSVGAGPSLIWISQDEGAGGLSNNGIPIDGTVVNGPASAWESNTTEDVWAAVDNAGTNGAMVCIYEEYETDVLPERKRNG